MTDINHNFHWELELDDGTILSQKNKDDWTKYDPKKVIRASVIPWLNDPFNIRKRHDVLTFPKNAFVRRFARGFKKSDNLNQLHEYYHCIVTEQFKFYVFSNGNTLVAHPDSDLYL